MLVLAAVSLSAAFAELVNKGDSAASIPCNVGFGLAGFALILFLIGNIWKKEPTPFSQETCTEVSQTINYESAYKSTAVNPVLFKVYRNERLGEEFSIKTYPGTVYPKNITCYRVQK